MNDQLRLIKTKSDKLLNELKEIDLNEDQFQEI